MNSACIKWWEQIVHLIWAWSALLSVKWNAVRSTHNFYLSAKSIKPAAVLSKHPLRAHSSAWSSISTSYIEDQLLYNIRLLSGFSQRVFVVLKGCWATFGVMYLDYLTWRYSHRNIKWSPSTWKHQPSKITKNITLKPHPAEVLLKHDPPLPRWVSSVSTSRTKKKLLAPTAAVERGGLEKNRPKGQDWKGLMLRWREQFQITQITLGPEHQRFEGWGPCAGRDIGNFWKSFLILRK